MKEEKWELEVAENFRRLFESIFVLVSTYICCLDKWTEWQGLIIYLDVGRSQLKSIYLIHYIHTLR